MGNAEVQVMKELYGFHSLSFRHLQALTSYNHFIQFKNGYIPLLSLIKHVQEETKPLQSTSGLD